MPASHAFVPLDEIKSAVNAFLSEYGTRIAQHTDKIGTYAEIAAYHSVIEFYRKSHFRCGVENVKQGLFRYKLTPTGNPSNFSYFSVRKSGRVYSVLTNVSVESAHAARHYFSADIVVADDQSVQMQRGPDNLEVGIRRSVFFVPNESLRTFLEIKNMSPFPELLFSFSGLLFEMMPDIFFKKVASRKRIHIAPSLVCSFAGSGHANYIRRTLLQRWHINIFTDFLSKRALEGEDLRKIADRRLKPRSLG